MTDFTLNPNADHAQDSDGFTSSNVATFWGALSGADDTSFVYFTNNFGANDDGWVECEFEDLPPMVSISNVRAIVRGRRGSGAAIEETNLVAARVKIGGTSYNRPEQAVSGTLGDYFFDMAVAPSGVPWTSSLVNSSRFGVFLRSTGYTAPTYAISPDVMKVSLIVSGETLPADQGGVRAAASRKLFLRRAPQQFVDFKGGLHLLDLAPMTQVDLHHLHGVHESGQGWEPPRWKRGVMTVQSVTLDPMTNQASVRLRNDRPIRYLMYDSGHARQGGVVQNGRMQDSNGASWHYSRTGDATFTDLAGDTVTVQPNVECLAADGQEFLAASGGRGQDLGYWSNNAGFRTYEGARNTTRWEATPRLSTAGAAGLLLTLFYVPHASDYAWCYYDGSNARWVFELRIGGVVTRALKSASIVANTRYVIGTRTTGSNGELGLAAFTQSVFVDGVKGTDAVAAGAMTESATSNLYVGSKNTTDPFRGCIRRRISRQMARTDIEMARSFS